MERSITSYGELKNINWQSVITVFVICLLFCMPTNITWSYTDLFLLIGMGLICLISLVYLYVWKIQMTWTIIDSMILLYGIYLFCNTIVLSNNPIESVIVRYCWSFALYWGTRVVSVYWKSYHRTLVFVLSMVGLYEGLLGLIQVLGAIPSSNSLSGSFFNPGPYGCFLSVIFSILIGYYRRTRGNVIGIVMLVTVMMLPASDSRTGYLTVFLALFLVYRHFLLHYWKWLTFGLLLVCICMYLYKQNSADSRTIMSIISIKEWMRNPLLGCGLGGYIESLSHGQIEYFSENPYSPYSMCVGTTGLAFNEYLKIAVEQGLIGLFLYISVIAVSIWKLIKYRSPLAYGLICISFVALFSYPFVLHPFCILLTLLISTASCDVDLSRRNTTSGTSFFFILLGCFCMMLWFYKFTGRRIEVSKDARTFQSLQDTCFIDDYYELLPEMKDNRDFLFDFAQTLRKSRRWNESNAILRMGSVLDTDPMVLVIMGRNYEDLGMIEYADSLYAKAFYLQPNRIYPLFRQMKMYEANSDTIHLKGKAKQIVDFCPKIQSPATIEMQCEAEKYLEMSDVNLQ